MTPAFADPDAGPGSGPGSVVVVVPTYDERESLPPLLDRIEALELAVEVLVVDDGSPDGTGEYADQRAARTPWLHVLHRTTKEGLGAAYLHGFAWALRHGADVVVEMDADGSHQPEQLVRLLAALEHADVVIGSRYVPGGSVEDWPLSRRLLSRGGNLYIRAALGVPLRDSTAGFRAFRRTALETISLEDVESHGYVFQADLARRAIARGLRVVEVPITFVERTRGESKMTADVAWESLRLVTRWGVRARASEAEDRARRAWRRVRGSFSATS
ncbi:polyprenol monophosphomannose synthase [Nocardioidaceae bacterium]|nr:polyprenol monophosphomannose synthase [Nocardioidaceae bacterium]